MARLIFSNRQDIVKQYVSHCVSVDFKKYTEIEKPNLHGAVFKKLCLDNVNVITDGDDMIAAVGTYFYKKEMAGAALEYILQDIHAGKEIYEIRNAIDGNFAMVVYQNGNLYGLTDALGVHYLYYYVDNTTKDWIIGTSLYEMAKCLPRTCSCNEFNLIEDCYQYGIWGGDTLLNEFKRVEGDKMCVVDVKGENLSVQSDLLPQYVVNQSSLAELTENFANEIKDLTTTVGNCIGKENISIFMTGGLDSRLTLSGILSSGIKPHMYYGVGNSLLTNTKAPDLDIDKMYEKQLGLDLTVLDYSNELPLDKDWDEQLNRYGFLDHFSTVTPNQRKAFISVKEPFIFYGMNGEAFRNEMPIVEHAEKEWYTIEEVRDNYYIPDQGYIKKVLGVDFQKYKDWLKEKQMKTISPYLNNDGTIPRDLCSVYYLQCMIAHDTHKTNILNQFKYCMTLGSNFRFMKYVVAPTPLKDDSQLILGAIEKLYPSLLDMPFFSRYGFRRYDREQNRMIVHKTEEQLKMESKGAFFNKFLSIWRAIVPMKIRKMIFEQRNFLKDPKSYKKNAEREAITKKSVSMDLEKMIDNYPMFVRRASVYESSYIPREAHLALNLRALDKLGIKKLKK